MGLVARKTAVLLGGAAIAMSAGMLELAAQDAPAAQGGVTTLPRIVIDANGKAVPEEVPAAVSEISGPDLERFGRDNLDDVLRSTPGTFTRENPQQPGVAVNVRGFEGSGRVNTMIDGVRQNFRFTSHEAAGFTYVDPNLLSQIDIARGAVSTAGGGALAGSVNFRTIGVDDVVRDGRTWGVLGRTSAATNGTGFSGMIAGGVRQDAMGFVGAISGRRSTDYKNGDGVVVPNTGQELMSGLFKAEFGFGEDHMLSIGGILYHNDFAANSYYQNVDNRTLTANYRYAPSDNDLIDLQVNAYYNHLEMEYEAAITPSPFATGAGRIIRDEGVGFDISNTSRFSAGEVDIVSTNGFEYFYDDVSGVKTGVNPADGNSFTGGAFTQNTFSYGIFDLTGALRYDFYGLDGAANSGPGAIGEYVVDLSEGSLNPKITLAAQALDWLQPYVTYAHSMRAPTLQETMVGGDHPGGSSASFLPNPFLEPEKQRGWEVGFNVKRDGLFTANDALRAKVTYFDMRIEDFIAARMNPTLGRFQFVNLPGTSRQRGLELSAMYDVGVAFAGLAYTHTDTDLPSQQPGLGALSYLPDDVVALTLGTRLFEERLTVGTRINYVSNGIGNVGNEADPTATPINEKTPGYTLVDLFASYEFENGIEVAAKVTNLFDETYTPALSTIGTGQGRTFHLSTQFRF